MSLDELKDGGARRQSALLPALSFVGGFSLIFLLMGASATLLGQLLFQYQVWLARIGGVLVILFGLHLLGILRVGSFMRERRFHLAEGPKGYFGASVAGMAFAAGWTPCIGPVLGALWTLASVRATMWGALLLLGGYSLGLAVPFILAAVATDRFLLASRRLRRAIPVLEKASGGILLIVGILLVTGSFTLLSSYFVRFTPDWVLRRI